MARRSWALLAGVLLLLPALARGADPALAGNWKFTLLNRIFKGGEDYPTVWLVHFENQDGKWTGKILSTQEGYPKATLSDLVVTDQTVKFNVSLKVDGAPGPWGFEAPLPKEGAKTIRGSLEVNELVPVRLDATTAKTLDSFELNKEIVAGPVENGKFFEAALDLLSAAEDNKAKPEEVRGWADKAYKAAGEYGPRYKRDITLRIGRALVDQEGMLDTALTYARKAEQMIDEKDTPASQIGTLGLLATVLRKAKKEDELKEVEVRLDKLIDQAVKAEKFAGRKGKSDRVVLVEMFTGAECPPCRGADVAFDGLTKTYQPSEVVFLQYHLHAPGPDPLTGPSNDPRAEFYGVNGTPALILNGKVVTSRIGGDFDDGQKRYEALRDVLNELLEDTSKVKLKATAKLKDNKVTITADVSGVEEPGENVKLRLALVEEQVDYAGGNMVRHHHHVVRALPDGVKGVAIKDKALKHSATVDLADLKKEQTKYLDEVAKDTPFPSTQRPMELKNLKVVAFLQDDDTRKVLQAVQVDVAGE
jgi:thiol-disulfide isomerase/thioredoxin